MGITYSSRLNNKFIGNFMIFSASGVLPTASGIVASGKGGGRAGFGNQRVVA